MNRFLRINRLGVGFLGAMAATALLAPTTHGALVGKYDAGVGVTLDGGNVTVWADQVGGYDLNANVTPTVQPLATPNGSSAIVFEGAESDALGGATAAPTGFPLAGATALTTAVVFRPDTVTDNEAANVNFWGHPQLASGDQGGGFPDWGFGWGPDAGGVNKIWFGVGEDTGGNTPTVTVDGADNNGNWYIGIGTWNGAAGVSAYLYDQSGTLIGTNTLATPAATMPRVDVGFATAGERPNVNGRNFDGQIAAIELYDNGVDSAGAAAIAASLNDGYLGGTPIVAITIEVNTISGIVTLKNPNPTTPLTLDEYEIRSTDGALAAATWNSLDAQNFDAIDGADAGSVAGDSVGEGWDRAGGSNDNQLIEYFLAEAGSELPGGASISLGQAFDPSVFGAGVDGDLTFNYGTSSGAVIQGIVTYISDTVAVPGDYNQNGAVDAADYTVWRDSVGTGSLPNEGDGISPGVVDEADYNFWKTNFGNTAGSASAGGASAAVPEPTSMALFLVAISMAAGIAGSARARRLAQVRKR